jgi:hypothetical protein
MAVEPAHRVESDPDAAATAAGAEPPSAPVAALPAGDEPVAEAPLADVPHVRLGFFQRPAVQNVLPLATSVTVHLAIVLVGLLVVAPTVLVRPAVEEQIIVPDAAIVDGAEVGGIPNPGLGGDPTRAAAQDQLPDVQTDNGWAQRPSETLQAAIMGGGGSANETEANTVIGIGTGGSFARGTGEGSGTGTGGAATGTGEIAPFGIPGGGEGSGPAASFVGVSGNARRIVYICDATGTMIGLKYKLLQKQLYKAIDILKPTQGFNVIFFRGGDADADWNQPLAKELIVAKPDNKQKARKFIETFEVVGKGTNPLPALRTAFAQKPQLVYFLTDGQFDNVVSYDQVLAEVRRLNADKSVKINTIAFMSEDAKAEEALQTMARENGGKFVKVSDRDLE